MKFYVTNPKINTPNLIIPESKQQSGDIELGVFLKNLKRTKQNGKQIKL